MYNISMYELPPDQNKREQCKADLVLIDEFGSNVTYHSQYSFRITIVQRDTSG